MRATARRSGENYTHEVEIRRHRLTVDEPQDQGGADEGPGPQELLAASLATCTAITVEMYATRKGWELGEVEVDCRFEQPERGEPTVFTVDLRVSQPLSTEQLERLNVIAAKCPVHRILDGHVSFEGGVTTTSSSPR